MGSPRPPHHISTLVKRLYLLQSQRLDEVLKPHGLARGQWQVLWRVAKAGSLSQRELQEDLKVESATLTGIVDVLVSKSWLERFGDESDKRVRRLRLTENGEGRWRELPNPIAAIERRMFEGMSAEQKCALRGSLELMIRNLEGSKSSTDEPTRKST